MSHPHTVMVIMEAKPEKQSVLKQELLNVRDLSRKEPTCLGYHLHQDINNSSCFILYENWKSKAEHEQQFQKPYIIALGQKLDALLAKPYQVIFSKEL